MSNSTKKNILFLLGAGAAIRTGCPSTYQITEHIRNAINTDPFLEVNKNWALSVWEIIDHICRGFIPENDFNNLPENVRKGIAHTNPNFEHFATAIDTLKEYCSLGTSLYPNSALPNPLNILNGADHPSYKGANDFLINRLMGEIRFSEAIWQNLGIWPTIVENIETLKNFIEITIQKLFPKKYNLSGLEDFVDCLRSKFLNISLATTNYDLSLDYILTDNKIKYVDGFSKIDDNIFLWSGFHSRQNKLKYLKLHGSSNWYRIPDDWFFKKPKTLTRTQIYKYHGDDVYQLIRPDLIERDKKRNSIEFGSPHMVVGGFKDRKFLDLPFTEIGLEFMSTIKVADTIVIIGHSGIDTHLMKQFKGLISTNKRLEKAIVIDINPKTLNIINLYFSGKSSNTHVFNIGAPWDPNLIKEILGISLKDMLLMEVEKLKKLFTDKLNEKKPA
jgi:hypothetical protein